MQGIDSKGIIDFTAGPTVCQASYLSKINSMFPSHDVVKKFNVGFTTEVVPTVGGERGEGAYT